MGRDRCPQPWIPLPAYRHEQGTNPLNPYNVKNLTDCETMNVTFAHGAVGLQEVWLEVDVEQVSKTMCKIALPEFHCIHTRLVPPRCRRWATREYACHTGRRGKHWCWQCLQCGREDCCAPLYSWRSSHWARCHPSERCRPTTNEFWVWERIIGILIYSFSKLNIDGLGINNWTNGIALSLALDQNCVATEQV
jgi:hypothetical protein